MDQHYKAEAVHVNNSIPAPTHLQAKYPSAVIFILGFLAALSLVQFIMMFFMLGRIGALEDELKAAHREVRQEIIYLLKKGG